MTSLHYNKYDRYSGNTLLYPLYKCYGQSEVIQQFFITWYEHAFKTYWFLTEQPAPTILDCILKIRCKTGTYVLTTSLLFETFLRVISILHMVTHMNKYVIILGGIIAIIIGVLTLIPSPGLGWYKELIVLIKGGIGLLLIIVGFVAIFLGKD